MVVGRRDTIADAHRVDAGEQAADRICTVRAGPSRADRAHPEFVEDVHAGIRDRLCGHVVSDRPGDDGELPKRGVDPGECLTDVDGQHRRVGLVGDVVVELRDVPTGIEAVEEPHPEAPRSRRLRPDLHRVASVGIGTGPASTSPAVGCPHTDVRDGMAIRFSGHDPRDGAPPVQRRVDLGVMTDADDDRGRVPADQRVVVPLRRVVIGSEAVGEPHGVASGVDRPDLECVPPVSVRVRPTMTGRSHTDISDGGTADVLHGSGDGTPAGQGCVDLRVVADGDGHRGRQLLLEHVVVPLRRVVVRTDAVVEPNPVAPRSKERADLQRVHAVGVGLRPAAASAEVVEDPHADVPDRGSADILDRPRDRAPTVECGVDLCGRADGHRHRGREVLVANVLVPFRRVVERGDAVTEEHVVARGSEVGHHVRAVGVGQRPVDLQPRDGVEHRDADVSDRGAANIFDRSGDGAARRERVRREQLEHQDQRCHEGQGPDWAQASHLTHSYPVRRCEAASSGRRFRHCWSGACAWRDRSSVDGANGSPVEDPDRCRPWSLRTRASRRKHLGRILLPPNPEGQSAFRSGRLLTTQHLACHRNT